MCIPCTGSMCIMYSQQIQHYIHEQQMKHVYHVQTAKLSSTLLSWCVVEHLHIECTILHQRGLMALQRDTIVIGTTKRAENTAKFGTVAVLVNWPKENVNIYILTQRATFISCSNSLLKSWNCPLCVLCRILGGKSLRKTLHFFCWYHFGEALLPFYRRGEFQFLVLLWWFNVIIVLFLTVGISPFTHPQPKLLWNFPVKMLAS